MSKTTAVATLPAAELGALALLPFFLHHQVVVTCQGHAGMTHGIASDPALGIQCPIHRREAGPRVFSPQHAKRLLKRAGQGGGAGPLPAGLLCRLIRLQPWQVVTSEPPAPTGTCVTP